MFENMEAATKYVGPSIRFEKKIKNFLTIKFLRRYFGEITKLSLL